MEDHQKMINWKSFDERIIDFNYTIQEHLFEIAVCLLIILLDYPQSLTNADVLGQGNLNLVSEKSGNFTFYNLWEPCIHNVIIRLDKTYNIFDFCCMAS